jgi:flagellar hook-length control protein FliK
MTSLAIVDMLDSRGTRPAGPGASSRHATPGAAAFADVIQDAARTPAAEGSRADGAPVETATEAPSGVGFAPAPPDLGSLAPALTASVDIDVDAAVDADPLVAVPAEDSSAAAILVPTDAAAGAATTTGGLDAGIVPAAGVVTADLAAIAGSSSALSTPAGTGMPSTAVRIPPALPPQGGPRMTANAVDSAPAAAPSAPAAESSTLPPASALGSAGMTEEATTAAAPRVSTVGVAETTTRSERTASTAPTADGAADSTAPRPESAAPASIPAPTPATPSGEAPPVPPAAGGTPAVASAAALAPAAPAAAAARPVLLPQIAAPIVSLAQAADGDHSLTLTVSPENLGPVTVRAHISGGAIHIELHAPTDLGRDALRALLVDLRRDLAAAAPHASLLLSTSDDGPGSATPQNSPNGNGSAPGGPSNGTAAGTGTGGHGGRDGPGAGSTPAVPASAAEEPSPLPLATPHGGIEVFA